MKAKLLALAVAAACMGGPAMAYGPPLMPELRHSFATSGKGKRKHRMSGTGGRSRGNRCNNAGRGVPHQNYQECLRRVIGGWARSIRTVGLNKRQGLFLPA